jgi:hypothetical protein
MRSGRRMSTRPRRPARRLPRTRRTSRTPRRSPRTRHRTRPPRTL